MIRIILLLLLFYSCTPTKKSTWVNLDGSKSYDPIGTIIKYEWRQIQGATTEIENKDKKITKAKIENGYYLFELTGWNDRGFWDKDTLKILNKVIIHNKQ